jgi:hypothetical protein
MTYKFGVVQRKLRWLPRFRSVFYQLLGFLRALNNRGHSLVLLADEVVRIAKT